MNLNEWHWARLKRDLDLQDSFMRLNESYIIPEGTIVRGKSINAKSPIILVFIEHSNGVIDTFCDSYNSLLEPIEK